MLLLGDASIVLKKGNTLRRGKSTIGESLEERVNCCKERGLKTLTCRGLAGLAVNLLSLKQEWGDAPQVID